MINGSEDQVALLEVRQMLDQAVGRGGRGKGRARGRTKPSRGLRSSMGMAVLAFKNATCSWSLVVKTSRGERKAKRSAPVSLRRQEVLHRTPRRRDSEKNGNAAVWQRTGFPRWCSCVTGGVSYDCFGAYESPRGA